MTFWFVAGAMAVVAAGFVFIPLLWKNKGISPDRRAYDLEVYRDQLKELEAEVKLGEIGSTEAATARLEIERRILRAGNLEEATTDTTGAQGRHWLLAVILGFFVVATGLGLYKHLGAPDLPGHPFVYHENDEISADGIEKGQKETLEGLAEKLTAFLQSHPDNTEGWAHLRQVMAALDENPRAAQLMQKAVAAVPRDPDLRVMYGESLIVMSEGQITPAARLAFEQALTLAPNHPGAKYYLALASYQDGNIEAAYKGWSELAAQSPADAPWLPQVNARIREAAAKLGKSPETPQMGGPTPDQQAAAQGMAPADRDAMIRGMVQRLAERLKSTPGDYEGFRRLGRAYEVLGDKTKALEALRQAETAAPAADKVAIASDIARLEGQK